MKIDILTLFPEMFAPVTTSSIMGRAVERGIIDVRLTNIRDFSNDKHNRADDYPFGGGGGMVLLPLLTRWCRVEEKTAFATCVAVILPFCVVSAAVYLLRTPFDFTQALPYLLGGLAGGFVGGKLFPRVPAPWLRYLFAAFLVYGGIRYLL